MLDFSGLPFFDNHTHLIDVSNRTITMQEFISPFAHGYGDLLLPGTHFGDPVNAKPDSASEFYRQTIVANLGVVKTLVHYLSKLYGCAPDLDTVLEERNKRTIENAWSYTQTLYQEQTIIGEVVDSGLPMGDERLQCFPTPVYRLFQIDPLFTQALKSCDTYASLQNTLEQAVREALSEGFVGVKYHVLEKMTQLPHLVSAEQAQKQYDAARRGERLAIEEVYYAVFAHMLLLTQELNFPIHIHTGITGKTGHGLVHHYDPFYFCPMLNDDRYFRSHLVFLHCSYPNPRNVAVMANSYPNIWLDMAQVLPWAALNFSQILEEILGMAPHSKIMLGTGAHNHPEIIWMSAKIAKSALACATGRMVQSGLLSEQQAFETAEQVLYKNAQALYHITAN